jgi:hypothetical protein
MHEPRNDKARGQAGQGAQQVQREAKDTTPRGDLGNLTPAEIATAKLLHQQGVAWPIACLYVAWRRQYPHQHVGTKGSALLAESAAAGKAKRKGRR